MVEERETPAVDQRPVVPADPELNGRARDLMARSEVRAAQEFIRRTDDQTLAEQRELTEIPAPPFGERDRALRMGELMSASGLLDVELDSEGNVLGHLPGAPAGPSTILSAHLDTVFPAGTDVRVRPMGDRLVGPGIGDDGRGLAVLLAIARVLVELGLTRSHPILFVATVGEEGPGDLRGVRHLFRDGGPGREALGFISLDGAGLRRIVNVGLGVRRYHITARGPGGHSWIDWGAPNPIHVLGSMVAELADLELPRDPATTLTVSRWSGGTSINAIPPEAWVEMEVRSESDGVLDELDARIRHLADVHHGRATVGNGRDRPRLGIAVDSIGQRPSGCTAIGTRLVRAVAAATRAVGVNPELTVSSTDANIPMQLRIPAITIGAGGEAGKAHTLDEWYRNEGGPDGVLRALLTLLLVAEDYGS